jgi:hypothetical protein
MISNFDIVTYFAIREGFEPPRWDSATDKLAGFVVNPYPIAYLLFSALETRGCVCPGHNRDDPFSPPDSFRIT